MTHLTDDQFEDVLAGRMPEPPHVAACADCRDRLAGHRAVRARLQAAFASVQADAALADRVRRAVASAPAVHPATVPPGTVRPALRHRLPRAAWAALAAAVLVAIAIPAGYYFTTPREAAAAELVRIHTGNLAEHHAIFADADPDKLAEYLKTQLGFEPATPRLGQGMAMRGCCVAHFQGQAVGSYVVDTPRGPISIIVVPQTPGQLGMAHEFQSGGKTFWADAYATNHMVAVRRGDYTYCAVGEAPRELLTQILLSLGLSE
jgi:glycosyltransferase A (GT-A) superfamily protein (DUF2064 family)